MVTVIEKLEPNWPANGDDDFALITVGEVQLAILLDAQDLIKDATLDARKYLTCPDVSLLLFLWVGSLICIAVFRAVLLALGFLFPSRLCLIVMEIEVVFGYGPAVVEASPAYHGAKSETRSVASKQIV